MYNHHLISILLNSLGWTLVFKGIAGLPGVMSNIWQSPSTFNETSLDVLNIEDSVKTHYKNRIIQEWSRFNPTQVKFPYNFFCGAIASKRKVSYTVISRKMPAPSPFPICISACMLNTYI